MADATSPRRGVAVTPMEVRGDVILQAAALADELGYEVFTLAEGWGHDSTVLLATLAASTRRIRLAAGVLSIWGRTPGTIAMSAASLHQVSGGRFILGLGASTPQLAEGFHGSAYDQPARRLREVTVAVRGLLNGEPSSVATPGARPIRLGQSAVPELPIWIAASGDRTIRVAAELADGWFPLYLRRDRCREWAEEIAALRGERAPITVACGPFVVADDDVATARAFAAACTARYLTAMGEIYPRVVSAQGLGDEVRLVQDAARGVVPETAEALLTEFTAYGTPADVRDQLAAWDEVADITMVALPPGLPWPGIEATLRAAAP